MPVCAPQEKTYTKEKLKVRTRRPRPTARRLTNRKHEELSGIYALAAAGRALPRAAGSRSIFDAAEPWAEHVGVGEWVWVGVRAPRGRPAFLSVSNVVRVGVSACQRVC